LKKEPKNFCSLKAPPSIDWPRRQGNYLNNAEAFKIVCQNPHANGIQIASHGSTSRASSSIRAAAIGRAPAAGA
jgi:hypothetical protein